MELISPDKLKDSGIQLPGNPLLRSLLLSYLKVPRMNKLYQDHLNELNGSDFLKGLLKSLNISVEINELELNLIPKEGPFMVIANHPFGFLDGVIMLDLLLKRNPEFKVMANYFLTEFGPIKSLFIPVNPFQSMNAMNTKGIRMAMAHLKNGHPLGIFPAGEVATTHQGFKKVQDKAWDEAIIRFINKVNVPVIPLYFFGKNSNWFHLLGKVHPSLRTLTIPSEMFRKQNHQIKIRIGKPLFPDEMKDFRNSVHLGHYLRARLEGLGSHEPIQKKGAFKKFVTRVEPVIDPINKDLIDFDISMLRQNGGLLFSKSNYEVYLAKADQIQSVLLEIGRLREATYRAIGEGTNKKIDLDQYDRYYLHLFVFNKETQEIVGAYRLGPGDEIFNTKGKNGFYIQSLFDLSDEMVPILKQTLELGRSFVVKEYQQKPMPLFLLWQGILHFLIDNKQFSFILGPLSISNSFSEMSKDLLVSYVKRYCFNSELTKFVRSRKPYKIKTDASQIESVLDSFGNDLSKLDRFISSIEITGMRVPVLLKQYIKQRANFLAFNVDPAFNNSLDGLMMLNLKDLPDDTFTFLGR